MVIYEVSKYFSLGFSYESFSFRFGTSLDTIHLFRETKVSSTETVTVEISEIYASDFYEWSQTDCAGPNYRNDQ